MKNKLILSTSMITLFALAGCQQYLDRREFVSPYTGNAAVTNAANQTIDPWPSYVYDTDIQTDSKRQAGAIRKYREKHEEEATGTGPVQLLQMPVPPS